MHQQVAKAPSPEERDAILPKEVPATLKLYLDGVIEQMWFKLDAPGVVFLVNAESVDAAKIHVHGLPMGLDRPLPAHSRLRGPARRERNYDPEILPPTRQRKSWASSAAVGCLKPANVSKEEQLARFAQRLDDPARNWKISEFDYSERALWDDYIEAFEDAMHATSTRDAPWFVIPSNHKWFRNLAVSQIMSDTMDDLGLAFPAPSVDLVAGGAGEGGGGRRAASARFARRVLAQPFRAR